MTTLPSGYTQVEFIESTGTQYINTGVYPSENKYRVSMKFRYIVSHNSLSLFGNSSSRPYSITIYSEYPVFYVGDRSGFANGPKTTLDTDYVLDVTACDGTLTAIWNGAEHVDTYTGSLFTGRPIFVFGANGGDRLVESDGGYRLYYFQIYNDDALVRDFLPCIDPSGEIGLYDVVEGVFYPNAGSGEFVAGAIVSVPDTTISIDFCALQGLTIPEGVVTQIADASGRVLWSAIEPEPSILYLRPSADISVGHTLYPTSSTTAYLLISEEVPDDSSTYIIHTITAGDTSTYSKTSSFRFSCSNVPQTYKIKSAKMVVKYSYTITNPSANTKDLNTYATITANGIKSETYNVNCIDNIVFATWREHYVDITDFMKNKSLSSDFVVELEQSCSDCTQNVVQQENTGSKTYSTTKVGITTAWIEIEYV